MCQVNLGFYSRSANDSAYFDVSYTVLLPCVIFIKTRFRHIMTFTSSHDYPVVEYEHMRHVTHSDINVGVHFGDNHVVSGLAIV